MDALTIYCFESTKVIHLEDIGFKLHIPIRIYKHYMIFFFDSNKKGFPSCTVSKTDTNTDHEWGSIIYHFKTYTN